MVGGFESHIEEDHNLWNYLFFMYAVKKKDETEYNGMESYVAKKIENFDITFMPANRAMCIKTDDETKDNLQNQIKNMIKKMEVLNSRLSK
jgi:DNA-directed RNA polymerase subunit L